MDSIKVRSDSIEISEETTVENAKVVAVTVPAGGAIVEVFDPVANNSVGSISLPAGLWMLEKKSGDVISASANGVFATSVAYT
jgi:hypothetical protein